MDGLVGAPDAVGLCFPSCRMIVSCGIVWIRLDLSMLNVERAESKEEEVQR